MLIKIPWVYLPIALEVFLSENTKVEGSFCMNKKTGKRIKACVPMHTFGHPCRIDEIVTICNRYNIDVIEDAAESLGSFYSPREIFESNEIKQSNGSGSQVIRQHTGTFGKFGTLSFNGNKTITTGGGGMILTNDDELARLAKRITTTAKVPHRWEFVHDMTGYNYRLTNLAAALGCAQMEQLPQFLIQKRKLAEDYSTFFKNLGIEFVTEPLTAHRTIG